jgi:hypothetical protein
MSNDTVIATLENIRRETTAAIRTIKHFDTVCGHPPTPAREKKLRSLRSQIDHHLQTLETLASQL